MENDKKDGINKIIIEKSYGIDGVFFVRIYKKDNSLTLTYIDEEKDDKAMFELLLETFGNMIDGESYKVYNGRSLIISSSMVDAIMESDLRG